MGGAGGSSTGAAGAGPGSPVPRRTGSARATGSQGSQYGWQHPACPHCRRGSLQHLLLLHAGSPGLRTRFQVTGPVFTETLAKIWHVKKPNTPQNKLQPVLVAVLQPRAAPRPPSSTCCWCPEVRRSWGRSPGQRTAPAGPGGLQFPPARPGPAPLLRAAPAVPEGCGTGLTLHHLLVQHRGFTASSPS